MTTPGEFERAVADDFERRGYTTKVTGGAGDWGIDVIATKGDERLAVQAKMYGQGRPINRRQVFELFGASAYFGCTGSVLATDGRLMADAAGAAERLGIAVLRLDGPVSAREGTAKREVDFDTIWRSSIMPLAGRTLRRPDGSTNEILAVDWSGLTRRTSGGTRQVIPIEIFRWAIERVLICGSITRDAINAQFEGRASSGIVLVLAQVPEFEIDGRPLSVRRRAPTP